MWLFCKPPKMCCNCILGKYNCNMNGNDHRPVIEELAASEGVFTTAQAAHFDVPRNVLAKACAAGRLVRVAHGAYRSAAAPASWLDEVAATWKLTAPEKMSHERMRAGGWDGVAVGGATAAAILGIGDFHLTPVRVFAPRRIGSRNRNASFGVRRIGREDVAFERGFPVTRVERTLVDLVLDGEDPSLVRDAYLDAARFGLDRERLAALVESECSKAKEKVAMIAFREE